MPISKMNQLGMRILFGGTDGDGNGEKPNKGPQSPCREAEEERKEESLERERADKSELASVLYVTPDRGEKLHADIPCRRMKRGVR